MASPTGMSEWMTVTAPDSEGTEVRTSQRPAFGGTVEDSIDPSKKPARHTRDNRRTRRAGLIVGTIGFCLVVWFLRRPDQLLHPYVWVEEYELLNTFQTHGFLHVISSRVSGYYVWPTSFSVGLAAAVSFAHVPFIDYWFSTAWFVATVCLILIPASHLRLRLRMGMSVLMVLAPMNPEVYGIAEYSFWWTSLWPLISLIWSKNYWWLRIPVLLIGGMSSLAGSALIVPYAILFAKTRERRYLVGTAVLALTSVVQAIGYLTSPRAEQTHFYPLSISLQELRNFADYALTWLKPTDSDFLGLVGACILLGILAFTVYTVARERDYPNTNEIIGLVVGLLIVGIVSSIPAPLVANPLSAGPRYYFLPYVALSWVLLIIAVTSDLRWARVTATVLIVMSLFILTTNFARHDDRVSWSQQLVAV